MTDEETDKENAKRKALFHSLIDTAEYFGSGTTEVVANDKDGKVLFVAVYALGEEGAAISRFLKRRAYWADRK
jgi:hypothetical protein